MTANSNLNDTGADLDNSFSANHDVLVSPGTFNDNDLYGITIKSAGNITLTNVTANSNHSAAGAKLDNSSSAGHDVLVDPSTFNDNNAGGLQIKSAGKITLLDVTVNSNSGADGANLDNSFSSGHDVLVDTGSFNSNDGHGLKVKSGGNITLTNVTASSSFGGDGAHLDNSGTSGYDVLVDPSTFNGNAFSGLSVSSGGKITVVDVTANSNGGGSGAELDNTFVSGYAVQVGPGTFNGNGVYGLFVQSGGSITVTNVTASNNSTGDGARLLNDSVSGYDVSVDPSTFDQNSKNGLTVFSGGNITLRDVTANSNHASDGADLNNSSVSGYAVLVDSGTFSSNDGNGLKIKSGGSITLTNVTANSNQGGDGANLDNTVVTGYDVLVDPSTFSGNAFNGVYVRSGGKITLVDVTANSNSGGSGADVDNALVNGYAVQVGPGTFDGNGVHGLFVDSGGSITVTNVTANSNVNGSGARLNNSSVTGYDVFVDPSTFVGNGLWGLQIDSGGQVTLRDVNASSSVVADGAQITTHWNNGDVEIICSRFVGNGARGLAVSAGTGMITLKGVTSSGNGLPDSFSSSPTVLPFDCNPGPTSNNSGAPGPDSFQVDSGQQVVLRPDVPTTLRLGCMTVVFSKGAGDTASLIAKNQGNLPGVLPNGSTFVCGGAVNLYIKGAAVTTLPAGATLTVGFQLPAIQNRNAFKILFWNGSGWTELVTTVEGGVAQTTVNYTGIFVLVSQ